MSARPAVRRRPRRRSAGYTMIEVMMAVGVLTAGAVGIMAMTQASTRGNYEARQMTTAAQLAQRWVERLRRDAVHWRRGATTADPTLLAETQYLQNVPGPGTAPSWFVPMPAGTSTETAHFDHYGRDLIAGATPQYCTNIRLGWLYVGRAIRADVRVWYLRRSVGASSDPTAAGRAALAGCAPGVDPNTLTGDFRIRAAHASTVLRYTPPPATN
jgi:type IV pilus assembly protein PilV